MRIFFCDEILKNLKVEYDYELDQTKCRPREQIRSEAGKMELSTETITIPEKSARPNIFANFQRNLGQQSRSQQTRNRSRAIHRRQRRSYSRGIEPGRENDIPKRDYRTAFDAFGENNLIVWSNSKIPFRTCEEEEARK